MSHECPDNVRSGFQRITVAHFSLRMIAVLLLSVLVLCTGGITSALATSSRTQSPASVAAASYQAMDTAMNKASVISNPHAGVVNLASLLPTSQAHVSSSAQGAFLYKYDLYRVSVFHNWTELHMRDYSATKVWSTFQVTSTKLNGSTATVSGIETLHIDATVKDNGKSHRFSPAKQAAQTWIKKSGRFLAIGQTNDARALIKHTVTLTLSKSGWVIESDNYWDPLAQALTTDHQALAGNGRLNGDHSGKKQGVSPNSYTYYRSSAISYADSWWNSCNPNYTCYMGQGVDCANFVSQALYDGSGGNLPGDNNWYAGSYDFVNAQGLHDYMAGTFAAASYSSYDYNTAAYDDSWYEYPGDLVFYDWGNVFGFGPADGTIDHTAISVTQDNNGYTYEDAHTTNLYHYYWDLGGGTQSGYYFIVMRNNG